MQDNRLSVKPSQCDDETLKQYPVVPEITYRMIQRIPAELAHLTSVETAYLAHIQHQYH